MGWQDYAASDSSQPQGSTGVGSSPPDAWDRWPSGDDQGGSGGPRQQRPDPTDDPWQGSGDADANAHDPWRNWAAACSGKRVNAFLVKLSFASYSMEKFSWWAMQKAIPKLYKEPINLLHVVQ